VYVRKVARLGSIFCGNLADSVLVDVSGMAMLEPSRQALDVVAIRRSFSESTAGGDALLFDHRKRRWRLGAT
jgi:hypothetical protein